MLRRARRERMPALRARSLRLTARASALSNDELTRLILSLQGQLAALSLRMDQLAAKSAADTAALQAQLNALAARVSALEAGLGQLQTALDELDDALLDRIDQLEDDVGDLGARLTGVEQGP